MSSIGKIFVVVNLVLSLLLLGSLGALLNASRDTKDDVAALEQQLSELEEANSQAESEFNARVRQLDSEKSQLAGRNNDLEVERDNANNSATRESKNNQQLRDDVSKLTVNFDLLQSDLSAAQQRLAELQDANADLRTAAQDSQNDAREAELARRDLADQIAGYQSQIAALNEELTDTLDRARQSEMLVEAAKASGFDATAIMAMPVIDALVAQVDLEYGFVILDKGVSDNVEKGFTFDVFRGVDYLGQVRVDTVNENYSTAKITLSNGTIRPHDRATTKL